MTRDRRSPPSEDGLPVDRLLFDMIRDLSLRVNENSRLLSKALTGIGHLSQQHVGTTERLRRLEAGAVEKKETTLWAETLELFSQKQRAVLLILAVLVLLGIIEPLTVKSYVLGVIGLPPS